MIERLSAQIGEKRTEVQQLNTKVNEIEKVQKVGYSKPLF